MKKSFNKNTNRTAQTIVDGGLGFISGMFAGTLLTGTGIIALPVTAGILLCATVGGSIGVGLNLAPKTNTPDAP